MFPPLGVDPTILDRVRHPTEYKTVKVLAQIDGVNWYDISEYVAEVQVTNSLEFLEAPQIDEARITLRNPNNEWTPTQYWDSFDPSNGQFNGTQDQAYLQKEFEVKISLLVTTDLGTAEMPLFYGVKVDLKEEHQTATMIIKDLCYYATKTKLDNDLLYVNHTPDYVLTDLLQRALPDYVAYDIQTMTTPIVFLAKKDETIWQAVGRLVKNIGGHLSTKPDGTVIFRTRIEGYTEPAPAADLTQEDFTAYDLNTQRQYNKVKVSSNGYEVEADVTNVIDYDFSGDSGIEPGGTGNFDLEYLSEYAVDVSATATLTYHTELSGATIANYEADVYAGYNDGTIEVADYTIYADKLHLTINNLASDVTVVLDHAKVAGRKVNSVKILDVIRENVTDQPDKEYSVETFYADAEIMKTLADVLYDNINKTIQFGLNMNKFYADIYAGNTVTASIPAKGIASGVFLVTKVEHQLRPKEFKTSINIREWRGTDFEIGTHTVRSGTRSGAVESWILTLESDVSELQEDVSDIQEVTSQYDGAPPSTPTNLSLSTAYRSDIQESVVIVSFDPPPEADVSAFEVAWSTEASPTQWKNYTTTETVSEFAVPGNVVIYVKVRAIDAEGYTSPWSNVVSIVSAKDQTPPAAPTGLNAVGLFQTIMVKWNANTEPDFDHYVVEYSTASDFSTATDIITKTTYTVIKNLDVNTTYYIRIKAVDRSGNASAWSDVVSATTAKIDDESYYDYAAIKECIINNGYIDSAWISTLDAGLIQTGYLSADRIAAHSLTLDKLTISPAFSIPPNSYAYWVSSLVDELRAITPVGYEAHFDGRVTLLPENAPAGSVVGDLIAGNAIYAGHEMQVGTSVVIRNTDTNQGQIVVSENGNEIIKIGEGVLEDGSNGIIINDGKLTIKDSAGSVTFTGGFQTFQILRSYKRTVPGSSYVVITTDLTDPTQVPAFLGYYYSVDGIGNGVYQLTTEIGADRRLSVSYSAGQWIITITNDLNADIVAVVFLYTVYVT